MMLIVIATGANAQRADCPIRDAPMATSPIGKAPDWTPKLSTPETLADKVEIVEMLPVAEASEELIDVEEGHVTAVARMTDRARAAKPSGAVVEDDVDLRNTLLAEWDFVGYVPNMPNSPNRITRVFRRDGLVLIFILWDYAADGGNIIPGRNPSRIVGRYPATLGGMRAPSGCLSVSLLWYGDGKSYSLQIVGPLSLEGQRELVMKVARSINSVASRHFH